MYPDPKRVRDNRVTLRLDDYEHAELLALAGNEQPATVARELVMEVVRKRLEQEGLIGQQHGTSVQRMAA